MMLPGAFAKPLLSSSGLVFNISTTKKFKLRAKIHTPTSRNTSKLSRFKEHALQPGQSKISIISFKFLQPLSAHETNTAQRRKEKQKTNKTPQQKSNTLPKKIKMKRIEKLNR